MPAVLIQFAVVIALIAATVYSALKRWSGGTVGFSLLAVVMLSFLTFITAPVFLGFGRVPGKAGDCTERLGAGVVYHK